jgi:hypothetical protein
MTDPTYSFAPFGIDAAILYIGTTPVGQTRGGVTVDPGITRRDPEWDGISTPLAGQSRITRYDTKITGRFGMFSAAMFDLLNPGTTSDGSSGNNAYVPMQAREFLSENDELNDVRAVWRVSDNTFNAFVLKRARLHPWTLAGEDNNEVLIDGTIMGLGDPSNPNDCPFLMINDYDHTSFDLTDYDTSL